MIVQLTKVQQNSLTFNIRRPVECCERIYSPTRGLVIINALPVFRINVYNTSNTDLVSPTGGNLQARCNPAYMTECKAALESISTGTYPTMNVTILERWAISTVFSPLDHGQVSQVSLAQNFSTLNFSITSTAVITGSFSGQCYSAASVSTANTSSQTKIEIPPFDYSINMGTNHLIINCSECQSVFINYCNLKMDDEIYYDIVDAQTTRNKNPNSTFVYIPLAVAGAILVVLFITIVVTIVQKKRSYKQEPGKQRNVKKQELKLPNMSNKSGSA
ncbi:Hypothetical_protein [Hexamita inflata]|uniref:Hypothetical_protein n=1 Tax=Hexamita inflata TaxID=28002 RepID=A0AA86QTF2_9EUKA|nr:Hypothetical protein HINF_LOCUS2046 [Hexamita inflata]CAI9957635.1 Hypothetical protein HINF_LOCUS45280 [Hexamita inflata]